MLSPKQIRYKKQFKGKLIGKVSKGNKIIFGKYGLKALQETRLTARQIETCRRVIIRKMKKTGFLWIRVFPDRPITSKPTENRMGKGKGNFSFFTSSIKKGQILFEISHLPIEDAKTVFNSVSKKLPIQTKFFTKHEGL